MEVIRPDVLVAEIGSTTTVLSAFGRLGEDDPLLLRQVTVKTTVDQGDVTLGLKEARASLGECGRNTPLMACSSAAGGLVMSVHGLIYDMTVKAAREAALGAGAVVSMVTAGVLDEWDLSDLSRLSPGIILLAGGVDHGEKATVLKNARALRCIDRRIPVVYAGNIAARREVMDIMSAQSRRAVSVANVYPTIDCLNVEPARRAIQKVFEERITEAPGMEGIREETTAPILPTPGAVMEAAALLYEDIGDLMVVDVGGATTDVHSITEGSQNSSHVSYVPEPLMKRTVEGDLGVYRNASHIIDIVGRENISEDLGNDPLEILRGLDVFPQDAVQDRLVTRMTQEAVNIAVSRHAGRLKDVYWPSGRTTLVEGRDLTGVRWIVGTGGALTRLPVGWDLLASLMVPAVGRDLFPRKARVCLDADYVMAACGVLARSYPRDALRLLKRSLGL